MPTKKAAMIKIVIKDGNTEPRTVKIIPGIPDILYPTNTAVFIAIGPGADCARASISIKSSLSIYCFLSTTSFSISGTIA